MRNQILNFNKQFDWEPEIKNQENLRDFDKYILVGMGGSHLAAGLLKLIKPKINLIIHKNYGLPKNIKNRLVILSSYSGNTEEVLDAFKKTQDCIIIASNGELLKIAQEKKLPYIQMPASQIPRQALGYSFKALLKIVNQDYKIKLNPEEFESQGQELAQDLENKIPIIYASSQNKILAYIWKFNFNETSKAPSFFHVLPEMNHNELESLSNNNLTKNFYYIILKSNQDHPRIIKRMQILEKLIKPVKIININNIFENIILSYWVSFYLAKIYNQNPEQNLLVSKFKKLLCV